MPTINSALVELVQKYGPCVILLDEYDKAVVDAFNLPDEVLVKAAATQILALLIAFFETIKSLGEMVRFSFVI
jgi:ATP-dependent Clp protease ATP-binding subunit ClpA